MWAFQGLTENQEVLKLEYGRIASKRRRKSVTQMALNQVYMSRTVPYSLVSFQVAAPLHALVGIPNERIRDSTPLGMCEVVVPPAVPHWRVCLEGVHPSAESVTGRLCHVFAWGAPCRPP